MASSPARSSCATHGSEPSRGSTGSAFTSPTRCCRCGTPSRSRPATRDAALPYWAFAWGGGLAIARYLAEHPEAVDRQGGSSTSPRARGCARSPRMRAGASAATGIDIDRSPRPRSASTPVPTTSGSTVLRRDVLDEPPPETDVLLAGDCLVRGGPRRACAAVAPPGARRGASTSSSGPGPPLPADRRPRGGGAVRGPDHDRARGSRPQGRAASTDLPAAEITEPVRPEDNEVARCRDRRSPASLCGVHTPHGENPMTAIATPTRPRRHQAAPAGDLGERRLPHDRDPDPARLRAAHRGARRPLDRARARRRHRQRQRRAGRRPARLRGRRRRLRAGAPRSRAPACRGRGRRRRRSSRATPRRCPFEDGTLRRRHLGLRRDVRARPGADGARARARHPARRPDRPRGPHARGVHRPAVQDERPARPAAGRPRVADPVGHRGAAARAVRRRHRGDPRRTRDVVFRYPSPEGLSRLLAPLLRADDEGVRGGRRGRPAALEADLLDLIARFNRADDGTMVVPASTSRPSSSRAARRTDDPPGRLRGSAIPVADLAASVAALRWGVDSREGSSDPRLPPIGRHHRPVGSAGIDHDPRASARGVSSSTPRPSRCDPAASSTRRACPGCSTRGRRRCSR